nr:hypothetical protein [Tanacetum cinerariifolium]
GCSFVYKKEELLLDSISPDSSCGIDASEFAVIGARSSDIYRQCNYNCIIEHISYFLTRLKEEMLLSFS